MWEVIELDGFQDNLHCSKTSSIRPCNYLTINDKETKCKLFKEKLTYDWDYHAYYRCEICKDQEYR